MLERYFIKPRTLARIRDSWLAAPIERYVGWLAGKGYAPSSVRRRVPFLMHFGVFARDNGAHAWDELPALADGFVELRRMDTSGPLGLRDQAILLFLYNTGARVQEVADLRIENLELDRRRVHLHGKGDKWRTCPLWDRTAVLLRELLADRPHAAASQPVFRSQRGNALTRFGLYKIVRRHTRELRDREHGTPRNARRSVRITFGTRQPSTCSKRAWKST